MALSAQGHLSASAQSGTAELALQRTFKDSVFTSLFSDQRYAYELYRALHPEDRSSTADDVRIVTIQNTLTTGEHNDLGFIVGDTLLVLVEAQSTWSPNIALRALLYTAQTLKNIIHERELDVYGATPVSLPRPELYVIYTGQRKSVPKTITLSEALFGGEAAGIESTVHILNEVDPSLPGQYIDFTRTMDAWRLELGANERAVRAAITECLRRGVLVEYLTAHETEVVSIMMTLYDSEEVLHNHIAAITREAVDKGRKQGRAEGLEEGRERGREEGHAAGTREGIVRGIVETCRDLGLSEAETAARVSAKLGHSPEDALAAVRTYWQ